MAVIIFEPEQAAQVNGTGEAVAVTDRDGKLPGHLIRPEEYEAFKAWRQAALDRLHKEPTVEEMRAALSNPRRYSTEDILRLVEE